MTCSSPGKILAMENQISFSVDVPEDHFFLSLEGAQQHVQWLQQMKQRFIEKKKDLKPICLDYLHEGQWLEPRSRKK